MTRQSVRVQFDDKAVQRTLDQIGRDCKEFCRPSAQAGAQVLYEEVRVRVQDVEGDREHFFYGSQYSKEGIFYGVGGSNRVGPVAPFRPGNLRDSIYQVFSADNSVQGAKSTYHVSWNKTKAPYGYWVENGTSRSAAKPFLRPAYDAAKDRALYAAKETWLDRIDNTLAQLR